MNQKHEICLVLASNKYVDLSDVPGLFKNHRGFRLYKWVPEYRTMLTKPRIERDVTGCRVKKWEDKPVKVGVWQYWMIFMGGRWKNINEEMAKFGKIDQKEIMMKGHLFFDTEEDFMNWLPEDQKEKMFMDLI